MRNRTTPNWISEYIRENQTLKIKLICTMYVCTRFLAKILQNTRFFTTLYEKSTLGIWQPCGHPAEQSNMRKSVITRLGKSLSGIAKPIIYLKTFGMAKSSFEYVKQFELDDSLLPNTWIVIRLDGKCFHKFSDDHEFSKPNDLRALKLMNYAAFTVMKEFHDLLIAFGQSDEYSFIFKKESNLYKRRAAKLLTTINSKFSSSYVFYWNKFFGEVKLKYPPTFDGRIVLYPTEENLIDYLKWRQADVHINNLYNTTFWTLVLKGNLSPAQAEKRLCGTVSADKNEILFQEFNINYNNEPEIFKRGTILMRKIVTANNSNRSVIVDVHDDMLRKEFWNDHQNMLLMKLSKHNLSYKGTYTDIISEQINHYFKH